jgi:hypothetical protein
MIQSKHANSFTEHINFFASPCSLFIANEAAFQSVMAAVVSLVRHEKIQGITVPACSSFGPILSKPLISTVLKSLSKRSEIGRMEFIELLKAVTSLAASALLLNFSVAVTAVSWKLVHRYYRIG